MKSKYISIAAVSLAILLAVLLISGYLHQRNLRIGYLSEIAAGQIEINRLDNVLSELNVRYDSLEIVAQKASNEVLEAKKKADIIQAGYYKLKKQHEYILDSIQSMDDESLYALLLEQSAYSPDCSDSLVLIPMPVIRFATVQVISNTLCLKREEQLQQSVFAKNDQISSLNSLVRIKDEQLIVSDSIITTLNDKIGVVVNQNEAYKKDAKRQRIWKWVGFSTAAVLTGVLIAK